MLKEIGVLFSICSVILALPTPEEVYVENKDMCIEPQNVSDEVEKVDEVMKLMKFSFKTNIQ